MPLRIPVGFIAEYRGVQPPSSFTRRDTGEQIDVPAKLKFEVEYESGDVEILPLSQSQLDRCTPPVDTAQLVKGDHVQIIGQVVLQDRGSDRDSYLAVTTCLPAGELADLKATS